MRVSSTITSNGQFVAIDTRDGSIMARNCPLSLARPIAALAQYRADIARDGTFTMQRNMLVPVSDVKP